MKYPKSWEAERNTYGLNVSYAIPGSPTMPEDVFALTVYALPPKGQRRRIHFTMDLAHAAALAEALTARVASARMRQHDRTRAEARP